MFGSNKNTNYFRLHHYMKKRSQDDDAHEDSCLNEFDHFYS